MDTDSFSANTDNLAVVDPHRRRVVSVPRDMWDAPRRHRINKAWASGGFPALQDGLERLGWRVDAGICLRRSAAEAALSDVSVTVPVERTEHFLYPREPGLWVEDGPRVVRFDPPEETLSGMRVHEWLGARKKPMGGGSELARIGRQQVFVRALLRQGFDFGRFVADPERVVVTDPSVFDTLALVDDTWEFIVDAAVLPRRIDGMDVWVRPTATTRLVDVVRRGRRFAGEAVGRRLPHVRLPTGGRGRVPRRERLVASIAVLNEEAHLPAWLENVSPHVDGIVALDDGSADRSVEILEAHPKVLTVIRRPAGRAQWEEVDNHRRLVRAALDHGATWIVALDADERVELTFRDRVERAIRRGRRLGLDAFALPLLELWDSPDTWRCDGRWRTKRQPRLFAAREDHAFDVRLLHAAKAPLQGKRFGGWVTIDCRLYHLHMIERAARDARRRRYEELDPDAIWQPIGYAYLTDETGLRLRRVGRRRGYAR